MTNKQVNHPPPSLKLGDVLYVIFRHKWKIVTLSLLGLLAAAAVPFVRPVPYQSDAKLYIRYVLQNPVPSVQGAADPNVRMPEMTSETIMNTEIQILTTPEVAEKAVAAVGPEKLLGRGAQAWDTNDAAALILKNLSIDVPKSTSILLLTFKHKNPDVVQPVLRHLIDAYLERHRLARESGAYDERLAQETDDRRNRLARAREALEAAKSKIGIASVEETKKAKTDEMAKLEQAIFDAEAQLAERQAAADAVARVVPTLSATTTNVAAANTNVAGVSTNLAGVSSNNAAAFASKLDEYKSLCSLLETLRHEEQQRLLVYTRSSSLVKDIQRQIKENEVLKLQLEKDYPGLAIAGGASTSGTTQSTTAAAAGGQSPDYTTAFGQVTGLQKKIETLKASLARVQAEIAALNKAEGAIADAQSAVEREEAQFKHFTEQLDRMKTEERLGAGQVSNIYEMQKPTGPYRTGSKMFKMMAMICLAGVGGAIGLAFFIEFFLDQTMRRPAEVEARLGLPLFISVPVLHGAGANGLHDAHTRLLAETAGNGNGEPDGANDTPSPDGTLEMMPWDGRHELRPFSETLRDRLISYFEAKNLTHKPKLVAVTGCGRGSGISTVAAGLAASLSETGEGNVLLVDMNQHGAAQQFYKGDLALGLDDALEKEKRDPALVQDKLYVVSENKGETLPSALPRRFQHLVPRLKASDFDYIIFDMPPVNQISVTPRLAKFMDMNLLVVESEKTDREVVKRCSSLLAESKANVGIVMNKCRSYVPRSLQEEV